MSPYAVVEVNSGAAGLVQNSTQSNIHNKKKSKVYIISHKTPNTSKRKAPPPPLLRQCQQQVSRHISTDHAEVKETSSISNTQRYT